MKNSIDQAKLVLEKIKNLARQVNPEIARDLEMLADEANNLIPMIESDLEEAYQRGYSESWDDVSPDPEKLDEEQNGWEPDTEGC